MIGAEEIPYSGVGIINDPIHGYIRYTKPTPGETAATERDLIDHPWLQRLRYVSQLQSARWVYPTAEHTRFQHSLGALAVASVVARQLTPTLQAVASDCPSPGLVEALLRMTALLHDVGHGPFSHFFEENYLKEHGLTHEAVSARIVEEELGEILRAIRRTPHDRLEPGEVLEPAWIAYLIQKGRDPRPVPEWVRLLTPVFGGIYTADNMDYVLRDSYMCGVKIGPVDIHRLIYYTFFTDAGLTLHRSGMQALFMFLSARIFLYQNVYYHRTARSVDLQMREIFAETMHHLVLHSDGLDLDAYRELTDWSLFQTVCHWVHDRNADRRRLGKAWRDIFQRRLVWKPVYEATLTLASAQHLARADVEEGTLEAMIRAALPNAYRNSDLRLDLAAKDARPLNPLQMGPIQIFVYNPHTGQVDPEPLSRLLDWLPARVVQFRVFARDAELAEPMADAVGSVLEQLGVPTVAT